MKTLNQNELYQHLSEFLRTRGIEFTEGAYAHRIRQGCTVLTDVINAAQRGLSKAKTQVSSRVEEVRQVIHRTTAPPGAKATAGRRKTAAAGAASAPHAASRTARAPKAQKARAASRTPKRGS